MVNLCYIRIYVHHTVYYFCGEDNILLYRCDQRINCQQVQRENYRLCFSTVGYICILSTNLSNNLKDPYMFIVCEMLRFY